MTTLIGHLEGEHWLNSIITTPAQIMGIPAGSIAPGQPADLILFNSYTYNQLLSRPQTDREVVRNGQPIGSKLPDYFDLFIDAVKNHP
jgi:cytosine deaminase